MPAACKFCHHGRMISGTCPDLKYLHSILYIEKVAHYRHHMRSRYRLPASYRQRIICICVCLLILRDKKMSWDAFHRIKNTFAYIILSESFDKPFPFDLKLHTESRFLITILSPFAFENLLGSFLPESA